MISIHDVTRMVNEQVKQESEDAGQLTLGALIAALKSISPDVSIKLDNGMSPGSFSSYRGYYDHLAIEVGEPTTVGDFLERAQACMGRRFEGYKGGSYMMGEDTPVWVSEYGIASGIRIVGVTVCKMKATIKTISDDR